MSKKIDRLAKLFREEHTNWDRYKKLLPESEDVELIVLKGHLIIEEMLYKLAVEHFPYPKHFKSARLSFKQLSLIVRALVMLPVMDKGWEAIAILNTLRNKLSHNLEPQNINTYIDNLERLCTTDEPLPENYKPPETSAKKAASAICFIIGQLSILSSMAVFFERNKKIDLNDDTQPAV